MYSSNTKEMKMLFENWRNHSLLLEGGRPIDLDGKRTLELAELAHRAIRSFGGSDVRDTVETLIDPLAEKAQIYIALGDVAGEHGGSIWAIGEDGIPRWLEEAELPDNVMSAGEAADYLKSQPNFDPNSKTGQMVLKNLDDVQQQAYDVIQLSAEAADEVEIHRSAFPNWKRKFQNSLKKTFQGSIQTMKRLRDSWLTWEGWDADWEKKLRKKAFRKRGRWRLWKRFDIFDLGTALSPASVDPDTLSPIRKRMLTHGAPGPELLDPTTWGRDIFGTGKQDPPGISTGDPVLDAQETMAFHNDVDDQIKKIDAEKQKYKTKIDVDIDPKIEELEGVDPKSRKGKKLARMKRRKARLLSRVKILDDIMSDIKKLNELAPRLGHSADELGGALFKSIFRGVKKAAVGTWRAGYLGKILATTGILATGAGIYMIRGEIGKFTNALGDGATEALATMIEMDPSGYVVEANVAIYFTGTAKSALQKLNSWCCIRDPNSGKKVSFLLGGPEAVFPGIKHSELGPAAPKPEAGMYWLYQLGEFMPDIEDFDLLDLKSGKLKDYAELLESPRLITKLSKEEWERGVESGVFKRSKGENLTDIEAMVLKSMETWEKQRRGVSAKPGVKTDPRIYHGLESGSDADVDIIGDLYQENKVHKSLKVILG